YDRNASRRLAELAYGIQRDQVIAECSGIKSRRHDDVARGADAMLQQPVVHYARVLHHLGGRPREGKPRIVNVMMTVAGVLEHRELGNVGAGGIGHRIALYPLRVKMAIEHSP